MENFLDELERAWEDLSPQAQEFITIVAVVLVVLLLRRVLVRLVLGRLSQYTEGTRYQWDELALRIVNRPLTLVGIAAIILVSSTIFDFEPGVEQVIIHLGNSIIIVAIFLLIYGLVSHFTSRPSIIKRVTGIAVDDQLLPFVRTGIRVVLVAFAAVIIIDEWGYDVNGLVAGLGIGGLAIALAAQDTLANLFGFTTIVGDNPFVADDYIVTPDVEGVVESVGLRSTRIRQLDQAVVTIPNSKLSGSAITNWSRLYKRRVNFLLGITYNATSQQMHDLLQSLREMLAAREKVDADSVVVYFINFGDSALEILVRCYVFESDWGRFTAEREAINLAVMDVVESHGMSIAFPTQSIIVENVSDFVEKPRSRDTTPILPLRTPRRPSERIPQADEAEGGEANYDEMDDVED